MRYSLYVGLDVHKDRIAVGRVRQRAAASRCLGGNRERLSIVAATVGAVELGGGSAELIQMNATWDQTQEFQV